MKSRTGTFGSLCDSKKLNWILEAGYSGHDIVREELAVRVKKLIDAADISADESVLLLNVPGRIEVLGKHTDYAGGCSLTCASERSIVSLIHAHERPSLVIHDVERDDSIEIMYSHAKPVEGSSWSTYPATVLARLIRHFGDPSSGITFIMGSNIPSASGMSSSSAFVTMLATGIMGMAGPGYPFSFNRERFAGFAGALESGATFEQYAGDHGVGTRGGSQDHTAIICSEFNKLGLYSYFPVARKQALALPQELSFVIGSSGVKASKTGNAKAKYNLASDRVKHVLSAWNTAHNTSFVTLGALSEDELFSREVLRDILIGEMGSQALWDRYQQFDRENTVIIPAALEALESQNWISLGACVDESQRMASEWLDNQVLETRFLARSARELGAVAASSFGAGFGGAVWALVPTDDVGAFISSWENAYALKSPLRSKQARFFTDAPSRGVFVYGMTIPDW